MDIIKPAIVGMMCWGAMGCTEFVVTKTSDSNDGSCSASDCSLREAIIAANSSPGLDLITVPAGTYRLTREGPYENDAETGDLDIKESVTVNGFGSELTIIDGVEADRIFDVHTGNVAIRALTVTNGKIDTGGDHIFQHCIAKINLGEITIDN